MENKTEINPEAEQNVGKTRLNPDLEETNQTPSTVLNREMASGEEIYTEEDEESGLRIGMTVAEGYRIVKKMKKDSGEAELFIAQKDDKEFVLKYYRRENSIKKEVYELLLKNPHPNLPKLYAVGEYNGKTYEIMEYYPKGSLDNELLTEEEIRERFVPDMNEAIHKLEELNIIHKDIKPNNIARKADGHYVLMDFGISSVLKGGNSILKTKTGLTPEYAAPEALSSSLWSVRADYYSLGVTIYKLLFGVLPTDGMTDDEKLEYTLTHVLPIPKTVSEDIKKLILGLTYRDTANRKDPTNPNNRWDYRFVCRWLAGEDMIIPGSITEAKDKKESTAHPLEVGDVICNNADEVLVALAENWNVGKKYLMRDNSITYDYFRMEGRNKLAVECRDVADEGTDEAMMNFIYNNTCELDQICYAGIKDYPEEFGLRILKALWLLGGIYKDDTLQKSNIRDIIQILKSGVLTKFYEARSRREDRTDIGSPEEDRELASQYKSSVDRILKKYSEWDAKACYQAMFLLGYSLAGKAILYINGEYYTSYDEFVDAFENKMENAKSEKEMDDFIGGFFTRWVNTETPDYEFQTRCWMIGLGRIRG